MVLALHVLQLRARRRILPAQRSLHPSHPARPLFLRTAEDRRPDVADDQRPDRGPDDGRDGRADTRKHPCDLCLCAQLHARAAMAANAGNAAALRDPVLLDPAADAVADGAQPARAGGTGRNRRQGAGEPFGHPCREGLHAARARGRRVPPPQRQLQRAGSGARTIAQCVDTAHSRHLRERDDDGAGVR